MSAPAQASPAAGGGLAPALSAVRARLGLVALLFAVAALGWWWTGDRMRGMDNGPWTGLGSFGWFLGIWVVMMAAMMFPSVAPTVALFSKLTRSRSPTAPLAFTSGYLLVWGLAGVLAFMVATMEAAFIFAAIFGMFLVAATWIELRTSLRGMLFLKAINGADLSNV